MITLLCKMVHILRIFDIHLYKYLRYTCILCVSIFNAHHAPSYRLGGYPPFSDELTEYSLHDQICQARYSFPDKYWSSVSEEGKDMIKRLLTLDPKKRITTTEALEHPWMQDVEVIEKARKMMESASRHLDMPPPQLPVSTLSFSLSLIDFFHIYLPLPT